MLSSLLEKIIAGKWIAGPSINDALKIADHFNKLGMHAIINYLGEELTSEKDVEDAVEKYVSLIREIKNNGLDASISVKITQLGLRLGKELPYKNYNKLAESARKNKVFLWLDMEASDTVDETINAYKRQVDKGNVGIAIQAYLRRSANDIKELVKINGIVRLVKGAYSVKREIAFQRKEEINKNYERLMLYLFKNARAFTLATHDSNMIERGLELNKKYKKEVTYAMLNGIRNEYAKSLAERGERIAIYIPFGPKWIDYAYRRMRERGHVSLIMRSLISSK
ncbi:MAG: proline dehydrogenase family protein [Candidatus Micrarchaeota archaeon]